MLCVAARTDVKAQNWEYVGSPYINGTTSDTTRFDWADLEIDEAGDVYIAYIKNMHTIHVAKCHNNIWSTQTINGHSHPSNQALDMEVTKDNIYITFYSPHHKEYVYTLNYDGSNWNSLGDSLYASRQFDLLLDHNNQLTMVGVQNQPYTDLQVVQYKHGVWTYITTLLNSSNSLLDDKTAFFDNQNKMLISIKGTNPMQVGAHKYYNSVTSFDGNTPTVIGDSVFLMSSWNQLLIDGVGILHLTCNNNSGAYVEKLVANKWTSIISTTSQRPSAFRSGITNSGLVVFTDYIGSFRPANYCDSGKVIPMDSLNINGKSVDRVYDLVVSKDSDQVYLLIGEKTANDKRELSVIKHTLPKHSLYADVLSINEHVQLYPNPCKGTFTLENSFGSDTRIKIYNTIGRLIHQCILENNSQLIDMRSHPKGLYFVELQAEGGHVIQKLLIE